MRSLLKLAALFALFVFPLMLFGWFFWPTPYAYRTAEHSIIRIHRFTDQVDILRNTGWQAMKPAPAVHAAVPPPVASDSSDTLPPCQNSDGSMVVDPRELSRLPGKAAGQK